MLGVSYIYCEVVGPSFSSIAMHFFVFLRKEKLLLIHFIIMNYFNTWNIMFQNFISLFQ